MFRRIGQKIVCCSDITQRIENWISKSYFGKIGRYEPLCPSIVPDIYKRFVGQKGIYYPNLFSDTYMFYPKNGNIGIVVSEFDIKPIKEE